MGIYASTGRAKTHRTRRPIGKRHWLVVAALTLSVVKGTALAAEATCRDYVTAEGTNRAMLNGFVYGYVAAKLEGHTDDEINASTLKVVELVEAYCRRQPADRALTAVGVIVDQVIGAPRTR